MTIGFYFYFLFFISNSNIRYLLLFYFHWGNTVGFYGLSDIRPSRPDLHSSDFLKWPLHHQMEGARIQKVGHFFLDTPLRLSLHLINITLPRKPPPSLRMIWLKHLRSSEGWQKAGGKKKKMFHSDVSRDLLCLPVWAYSTVGTVTSPAQQTHTHTR